MSVELIAHRCGTDKYPELTIEAAKYSLDRGFSYVEMDIRFTKDEVPVISHDDNAARLFGVKEDISDMLLEDFLKLKHTCDERFHSCTLEDVLAGEVAPVLFHVKEGGKRLKILLDYFKRYDYEDKVIIGLSKCKDIITVKKFNPDIKVLAFMPAESRIEDFIENGADIIRLWEDWVTLKNVQKIKKAGLKVWIMAGSVLRHNVGYTSIENLIEWKNMGIDGVLMNEIKDSKFLLRL